MKTKEEILQEQFYKYYENSFSTKERGREFAELGLLMTEEKNAILEAMEEYGKQQYNQAIDDAAINAEVDLIYYPITSTTTKRADIKYAYVSIESILKLKK